MGIQISNPGIDHFKPYVLEDEIIIPTDTITIDNIPQTHTHLWLMLKLRGAQAGTTQNNYLNINDDTTAANYRRTLNAVSNNLAVSQISDGLAGFGIVLPVVTAAGSVANHFTVYSIYFYQYYRPDGFKHFGISCGNIGGNTVATASGEFYEGIYEVEDNISKIVITGAGNNLAAGSSYSLFLIGKH